MSKKIQSVKRYWNSRSELFGNYYIQPSLFDKIFRKGIYRRIDVSINCCKKIQNATVLDIGSGPGINSVGLVKSANASHVTGIDFSQKMNDYALEYSKHEGVTEKCEFILGDALEYDFQGKKYDLIIALGVFDYIQNSEALVKKMNALSNNSFVISWPKNGLRMWLRRKRYTCQLFHYTEMQIRMLHENAGIGSHQLEVFSGNGGYITIVHKNM
jgi:SAM-dependent methyltransferase